MNDRGSKHFLKYNKLMDIDDNGTMGSGIDNFGN